MAEISTEMVKNLRTATNAGILDCRKALVDADGDFEKAVEVLRKKGLASAAKKASRDTKEGMIAHYIHNGAKMASLVELNCETDFVARTEQFQQLGKDLAMHVVAARPQYLNRENVPPGVVEHEKGIYREQMATSGKPAAVVDKIVEGKLEKFYQENCLLEQSFIKDPSVTVKDLVAQKISKIGENMNIRRFTRFQLGQA